MSGSSVFHPSVQFDPPVTWRARAEPPAAAELKARLGAAGPRALDDREAVRVICGGTAEQVDRLFEEFGSLPEVLAAPRAALARCVPSGRASQLALARDLARRMLERPLRERPLLTAWSAVADYLRGVMTGLPREQFRVLFLDKRNRLLRIHLAVRALGDQGERLNPKKADLETWRQIFAQALRDRGVEAEATPRRARGVTRKAERTPLRKIRERHEAGQGEPAKVRRAAYREAARVAFKGETARTPWEASLLERQAKVRGLYLAHAQLLRRSPDPADRALGSRVEAFVRSMPQPDSQRLALARELRAANSQIGRDRDRGGHQRDR